MAVNGLGSPQVAAQLQAARQQLAPQEEQIAAAAVATANQVDPKQVGNPAQEDGTAQAVRAAHLGAVVDTEA